MLTFSLIASLQRARHTVEFFDEYCNKFSLQPLTVPLFSCVCGIHCGILHLKFREKILSAPCLWHPSALTAQEDVVLLPTFLNPCINDAITVMESRSLKGSGDILTAAAMCHIKVKRHRHYLTTIVTHFHSGV